MSNMILTSMDKLKIKEFINLLGHEQVTNFNFIDLVCSYMKEYVVLPRCDYCSCRENCDITMECKSCGQDFCAFIQIPNNYNNQKCLICHNKKN